MYITYIKVNNGCKSAIFEFDQVDILQGISFSFCFYSNGLAIWRSFQIFTQINVSNGPQSAILNFINFTYFRAYPFLEPHILLYCNSLAIWYGRYYAYLSQ